MSKFYSLIIFIFVMLCSQELELDAMKVTFINKTNHPVVISGSQEFKPLWNVATVVTGGLLCYGYAKWVNRLQAKELRSIDERIGTLRGRLEAIRKASEENSLALKTLQKKTVFAPWYGATKALQASILFEHEKQVVTYQSRAANIRQNLAKAREERHIVQQYMALENVWVATIGLWFAGVIIAHDAQRKQIAAEPNMKIVESGTTMPANIKLIIAEYSPKTWG